MVSIVVLSYNNLEYLFETLNSIFIQTHSDVELIIADDGSERFFESEIEKYIIENKKSNIKSYAILHSANNKGTVKNINNSLKICNGEIIKFIGADDLFFDKNVIEKVSNFMKKEKSLFLATNVQACNKSLKPIKSIEYFNKEMLEYLQNTNNIENLKNIVERKSNHQLQVSFSQKNCLNNMEILMKITLLRKIRLCGVVY